MGLGVTADAAGDTGDDDGEDGAGEGDEEADDEEVIGIGREKACPAAPGGEAGLVMWDISTKRGTTLDATGPVVTVTAAPVPGSANTTGRGDKPRKKFWGVIWFRVIGWGTFERMRPPMMMEIGLL